MRSCRRSKALTALVVTLMGFGVAACTLSYAVLRVAVNDPIPSKSDRLFVPQIDNSGLVNQQAPPLDQLSYTDATALLEARHAPRQTLVYPTNFGVVPADPAHQPFPQAGEAVTADFFAMFDVPFRYGHGWDAAADQARAPVVVITDALNRKLFGDADSTGRTLALDGHDYRISGVIGDFDPLPRFIDIASTWNGFGKLPQIYVPFARAVDQHKQPTTSNCNSASASAYLADWSRFLASECIWIDGWVELPDAASAVGYQRFLVNYATEQQRVGRFAWPANVRLPNVMQTLEQHRVVPQGSKLSAWISLGFLVVCLVNVVGLLLARFSRRGLEVGVRRALGASRREIVCQFLVEAALIGLAGGALGVLLTALGMQGLDRVFVPEVARLARLDAALMTLALVVAVSATLVASLWPTWRAAQVRPAWQLAQG